MNEGVFRSRQQARSLHAIMRDFTLWRFVRARTRTFARRRERERAYGCEYIYGNVERRHINNAASPVPVYMHRGAYAANLRRDSASSVWSTVDKSFSAVIPGYGSNDH